MKRLLLGLGLAVIPFVTIAGFDSREPKLIVAVIIALCLVLRALSTNGLGKLENPFLLAILAYIPVSSLFAYKEHLTMAIGIGKKVAVVPLMAGKIPLTNFWIWKPMLFILVFFLMYLAIKNIRPNGMIDLMVTVGAILSIYAVVQYLNTLIPSVNIEQFFSRSAAQHADNPSVASTLGQPTVLATFLAMLLPLAVYKQRWVCLGLMIFVIGITHSQIAIGASIAGLLFYLATLSKKHFILAILIGLVSIAGACQTNFRVGDGDRFRNWKMIVEDIGSSEDVQNTRINRTLKQKLIFKQRYPLTGRGLGSFEYMFHKKHTFGNGREYMEAHNDPLEIAYMIGLIGLILYLCAWGWHFIRYFDFSERKVALVSSLIVINICSLGLFVFQLGAHIFYTVTIIGLLGGKDEEDGPIFTWGVRMYERLRRAVWRRICLQSGKTA